LTTVHAKDAERWDGFAGLWLDVTPQRLWRRHSDAVNRALLAAWLPARPRRILKTDLFDEVASSGLVPSLLVRAEEVVAIDVSPRVVAAAGAANPALLALQADVRSLPFPDCSFDVVVSNSTLDHFASRAEVESALAEIFRVLEPGGHLVVSLDNPANPAVAARRAIPRTAFDLAWRYHPRLAVRLLPERVAFTCGAGALGRLLRSTGFEVAATGRVLHAPRALAVVVADRIERRGGSGASAYLRLLARLERAGGLPTRTLTGHFVAAHAVRPAGQAPGTGASPTSR
jgi:SAM-dependent methyltransferase